MNKTLQEILSVREDISDYVFHFTKGVEGLSTLITILKQKKLKDIHGKGFICFSEAPITMLPPMFTLFKRYPNPMYAPYGIGLHKEVLFKNGGRPVIYGDDTDLVLLPEEIAWRFVKYEPKTNDFSWLREWRLPQPELELNKDSLIILDRNADLDKISSFVFELEDIDIDAEPEDGGCTTFYTGQFSRNYKVVSIEDISEVNRMTKEQFNEYLASQQELEEIYLGSTHS